MPLTGFRNDTDMTLDEIFTPKSKNETPVPEILIGGKVLYIYTNI